MVKMERLYTSDNYVRLNDSFYSATTEVQALDVLNKHKAKMQFYNGWCADLDAEDFDAKNQERMRRNNQNDNAALVVRPR